MLNHDIAEAIHGINERKRLEYEKEKKEEAELSNFLTKLGDEGVDAILERRRDEIRSEEYKGLKNQYVDALVEKRMATDERVERLESKLQKTLIKRDGLQGVDIDLFDAGLQEFVDTLSQSNPVDMAWRAKGYFEKMDKEEKPYTFTGMLLSMGFSSPEEWNNYEKVIGFSRIMKMAKTKCANYIEEGMLMGRISPSTGGLILKSLHNWRENVVIHNVNTSIITALIDSSLIR